MNLDARAGLVAGGLLDDAAVFPPGDASLDVALARHRAYRRGALAAVVGPLVLADRHLAGLTLDAPLDPPLAVALVVPGGAAAVPGALATAARVDGLQVVAVEAPAGDLPPAEAGRRLLDAGVPAHLELAWHDGTPAGVATDIGAAAAAGVRVKLRTGGMTAGAFPGVPALAAAVRACVGAGVAFKCTAGLHHAVAHTDPVTGFEHHGFLNVVLAAAAPGEAEEALGLRDPAAVAAGVAALSDGQLAAARAAFVSFGTCSVAEPVGDLVTLGLLPAGLELAAVVS